MQSKILVLGLGISGKAAVQFLLKEKNSVVACDKNAHLLRLEGQVQHLLSQGLVLEDEHLSLEGFDFLILSPGIPFTHPIVVKASALGIEILGEIELAFRYIKNRCIGITGSNGKTTTTLLITHVLNASGLKARALGNVGVGLSSYLLDPDTQEILIVELSSFQLESLKTKCLDFALILNILENHLDRYPSMQAYANAKLTIQERLKENGKLFISDRICSQYNLKKFSVFDSVFSKENDQNINAAFAICREFGITENAFYKALQTFQKPPHRIEWVADIGNVAFYNDSKSSNVASVIHAVSRFSGPIVLIVGGTDKGSSYMPWIESFQGKVRHVVAYGLAKEKIKNEIGFALPVTIIGPFAEAVHFACKIAEEKDTVLLSPGCSSYDQFQNFERRGDAFKELILQRKNGS